MRSIQLLLVVASIPLSVRASDFKASGGLPRVVSLPALSASAPTPLQIGRIITQHILGHMLQTNTGETLARDFVAHPIPIYPTQLEPGSFAHYRLIEKDVQIADEVGGLQSQSLKELEGSPPLLEHVGKVYESATLHELIHWQHHRQFPDAPVLREEEFEPHRRQAIYILERNRQDSGRAGGLPEKVARTEAAIIAAWQDGPMALAKRIDRGYNHMPGTMSDPRDELNRAINHLRFLNGLVADYDGMMARLHALQRTLQPGSYEATELSNRIKEYSTTQGISAGIASCELTIRFWSDPKKILAMKSHFEKLLLAAITDWERTKGKGS